MKKYKAKKGAGFNDDDAQVIGQTIEDLRDSKGHITPIEIVENAKNKKSPIHNFFEWEESKAAEQYRLQQARNLVNHIVEIVVIQGEEIEQRSFFSVNVENNGKVYVTLKDAIENEDYREQLLNKAITQLENLTITMKMFKEYN